MPHFPSSRHVHRKLQRSFLLPKQRVVGWEGRLCRCSRARPPTSWRTASPSHQEALQAAPLSSRANEQLITWQRRAAREMSMILSDSDLSFAFKFPALQIALTPRPGHNAVRVCVKRPPNCRRLHNLVRVLLFRRLPYGLRTPGVLPARLLPRERALARVCRDAGARVACNVRVADINVALPVSDGQCVEVVFHGARDAPRCRCNHRLRRSCNGFPHPGADVRPGVALAHAERRKRLIFNEPEIVRMLVV